MTIEDLIKQGVVFVTPMQLRYYDYETQKSIIINTTDNDMKIKACQSDIRYIYIAYAPELEDLPVLCVEVEKPE